MSLVKSRRRHCKGHERSVAINLFDTYRGAVVRGHSWGLDGAVLHSNGIAISFAQHGDAFIFSG